MYFILLGVAIALLVWPIVAFVKNNKQQWVTELKVCGGVILASLIGILLLNSGLFHFGGGVWDGVTDAFYSFIWTIALVVFTLVYLIEFLVSLCIGLVLFRNTETQAGNSALAEEGLFMKEDYCDIFNKCFPQFRMTYERFGTLFQNDECCFEYVQDGKVVAFSIVKDFAIRLICVEPEKQKQGIGSKLLADMEKHMKNRGYEKVITGGVSSRVFIGAVSDSWDFWKNRGFDAAGGCDEMLLKLNEFDPLKYNFHGSEVAEYGWFEGEQEEIHRAVASVDDSWVKYYTEPNKIYVARVKGKIASFCLVDKDCQNYLTDMYGRIGMPGCVGTVPGYRNKGIALEMVANVTEYLKKEGMDISFIYFTGVPEWYRKIGYQTFLSEVFGEKKI